MEQLLAFLKTPLKSPRTPRKKNIFKINTDNNNYYNYITMITYNSPQHSLLDHE